MIDALVFSLYSNRGAYALLVGSGVSRAAGIPTGWEVTLDLIRKLAASRGEDPEPSPEDWYRSAIGQDLSYSKILRHLAWSKAERQRLLRGYFEPTAQEREDGLKVPTVAHRAVAQLAASGYVRVILTTNFDRLVEHALADAGVTPTVVSSPAQAQGALPLVHQTCLVLKLHGDYVDTDLKNTEEELAQYDPKMRRLLAQILGDFGLVICGWSGEWDSGLRDELEKVKDRRFATYWSTRGKLKGAAVGLAKRRDAQVIMIEDADSFFELLAERVESLAEYDRPHPLSTAIAVETLKRYLEDGRKRIKLHDLVQQETERVFGVIASEDRFLCDNVASDSASYVDRIKAFEASQETLDAIFVTGCYFGDDSHVDGWIKSLERMANPPQADGRGFVHLLHLSRFPALRLLYAGGLAAVAAGRYKTLLALLDRPKVRQNARPSKLLLTETVCAPRVVDPARLNQGAGTQYSVPPSDWLFASLREPLRRYLPSNEEYDEVFDLFEYLLAAQHAHTTEDGWLPLGRFGYKYSSRLVDSLKEDGSELQHQVLAAGFVGGSVDRLKEIVAHIDEFIRRGGLRW